MSYLLWLENHFLWVQDNMGLLIISISALIIVPIKIYELIQIKFFPSLPNLDFNYEERNEEHLRQQARFFKMRDDYIKACNDLKDSSYFKNCNNLKEGKNKYYVYAKKMHPDNGGNMNEFIEMKKQYDKLLNKLNTGA